MGIQKTFRIGLSGDTMKVATSLAPNSLTVSESLYFGGNLTIHGDVACDMLRGGSPGEPVMLVSDLLDATNLVRYAFISPIIGRIYKAHVVTHAIAAGSMTVSFFNEEGVVATSTVTGDTWTENNKKSVTFDWTDENDLQLCSVKEGTGFFAVVTETEGVSITICVEIVPLREGGYYG